MAAAVKVGEVRSLLERFDDTLEANSVDQAAIGALRNLCGMFTGSEEKTLASFLTAAGCAPLPAATGGGALIGSVVPMLESLLTLLSGVAKKDLLKSLDSLLDILRAKADASITVFVAAVQEHVASASQPKRKRGRGADPMDETLIDDYVRRLEAALGNDSRFKLLFEELRADQRITQALTELFPRVRFDERQRSIGHASRQPVVADDARDLLDEILGDRDVGANDRWASRERLAGLRHREA